uniref:Aminopeptidase n=1 Tax=Phaeomonas parva TaxID=124430 RepID=A0A7S1XT33_9STRA|mmetsp:Transcript_36740/g.115064  ORF Transcript_36740/g.115064 Transcript_36740/m.115064 type:complete len:879 (+) Transcript_36740:101-2737(+)|eukprot:CAMPEP_0118872188 /NCGR_PEP_ID=MMETSP1163-20130328/14471_1 /TAXON_ID=124430 /ORGANISM="Phaeomonas parva, Strain CCMP2877" /LENGTH=878 /DNA_ID=CAMNT_0006807353 /DNA_START=62 /DNA_END=2698 /DNA_ORIENTATION=+
MADDKAAGRVVLPPCLEPTKYILKITPDMERFVFDGEMSVELDCREATSEVVVHSKELHIREACVEHDGGVANAVGISYDLKLTTCTIKLDGEVPAGGKAVLNVNYMGYLNNQMAGFYRSNYTAANGERRVMASTQFEALDARRAFPCWDEPARKAVFELTLVVPANLHCFSNMPEAEAALIEEGRLRSVQFLPSPRMSTYLLAFCVGEFDFVQKLTDHGVIVKVYTPPGKSDSGHYALDVACRCLDLYDDFFGLEYPLPKLDMVAIPEFAMGAMENWGLVTYRMVDLLIDPVLASPQQKQRVATVVNHELAHQWFGNLVTMQWWDDLWLNEGFASWTETFANDALFPEWKMWEQFTSSTQGAALRLDSLRSSHPIQVPIKHAEEVEEVFDAISYCKGSSVVRLAHAVLGAEAFQAGLQAYMAEHQYGNTETTDLWRAWEVASGKPIGEIMSSWTQQMGFPLLTATLSGSTVKVTQRWFLSDGSVPEEKKTWVVPLIYATKEGKVANPELMRGEEHSITLPAEFGFLKLNWGQEVPLRVHYDDALLDIMCGAIRAGDVPAGDRAGFLSDCVALAKACIMPPEKLVQVLRAFADERDSTVWETMSAAFSLLSNAMLNEIGGAAGDKYTAFVASFVAPAISDIGWDASESDAHLDKTLRGTLFSLAGKYCASDEALAAEAKRRFQVLLNRDASDAEKAAAVPTELRVSLYKMVMRAAGEADFEAMMGLFAATDDNQAQKEIMQCVGLTPSEALRRRVLDWAISGELKLQDFFYTFAGVTSSGRDGLVQAWAFFKDNFAHIKSMLATASPSLMSAVIVYSTMGASSLEFAQDIESFFEANPLPQNSRRIAQLLENVRSLAKFTDAVRASPLASDAVDFATI